MFRVRETAAAVALSARNENVRRVELAWGAAIAAEWAHFVALGVYAYDEGGASAVGLAGLVRLLPAAVVAPVAGSLGDRFRRERFLLATTVLGALALAGSAAAAASGAPALVYVFAAVLGISATLVRPTLQALLPSLAHTPAELIASNGATSTIESIGTLAGPLVAGVLVSTASAAAVFASAAAFVGAASLLLTRVRVEGRVGEQLDRREGLLATLRSGLAAGARVPGARLVLGMMVVQTFVRGCLNVLIVVAAFELLGEGGAAVGAMTAAIGFGGLVGALAAMTFEGRHLGSRLAGALALWGVPIALFAAHPDLLLALVLLAVVGAANSVEDVAGFTLVQRVVPDEALQCVLAVFWGVAMGAVAVGSVVAPALVRAVGARAAFVVVGALLPVLTLAVIGRLRRLDRLAAPRTELGLLDHVPMFTPLSLAAKEQLAGKLLPLPVAAGECVIRAGDRGDRFYIVAAGELEVDAVPQPATMRPGDFFGEIALLRDVPRTATVTAGTESELYVLQRDDFLRAISGHRAAENAGRAVVERRAGTSAALREPADLPVGDGDR